jgi:hypothetical protein
VFFENFVTIEASLKQKGKMLICVLAYVGFPIIVINIKSSKVLISLRYENFIISFLFDRQLFDTPHTIRIGLVFERTLMD